MITRRFEYVGGGSNKFWEVTYPASFENRVHFWQATWGRRGTTGQTKQFPAYNHYEAIRAAEKKIEEKEAKGYREVGMWTLRVESATSTAGLALPATTAATSTAGLARPAAPRRTTRPAVAPPVSYERPKRKITLG